MALSASMVGTWALTQNEQLQRLGDILQTRGTGSADWLVPMKGTPKQETLDTIWATGSPWVELQLHEGQGHAHENGEELMEIRVALRASKGVTTRWTSAGLHRGECRVDAIAEVPLQQIWIGNSQGIQQTWKECVTLLKTVSGLKIKDVLSFGIAEDGGVIFHPQTHSILMESRLAQVFREVCLNTVANYPELLFNRPQQNVLQVKHRLEDPHHVFLLDRGNGEQIDRSWGSELTRLPLDQSQESAEQACARYLGVGEMTVWIARHPWLQGCMPIWTGKRRSTQNRKQYKKPMNKDRRKAAEEALQRVQRKLEQGHEQVAVALKRLSWTQIQRMEGVTRYQRQNIIKLKLNRLKMWAGAEQGYGCTVAGCKRDESQGTLHDAWTCKEAEEFWNMFLESWRLGTEEIIGRDQERARAVPYIFGFKMRLIPAWLTKWGRHTKFEQWDLLTKVTQDLWQIGVAVTLTHIWRRNVERVQPDGRKGQTVREASTGARSGVLEAMARGNPGPGGSGSVIVHVGAEAALARPRWVATTALGKATTTNNEAEFIGLHRVLVHAVERDITGIFIVGDSAMILRMMRNRTEPKSLKMRHWYRICRRLADICRVAGWAHHYRRHNKMADWLANVAMDTRRSVMVELAEDGAAQALRRGLEERVWGDIQQWLEETGRDSVIS
ncbi:unnamed protein product [Phytophthora fragariaefolia]|uniref:Unnamed protein product n=1 Tax=Phytophthora fragariaefolia TaxID=1490495 RepID=A0A9W6WY89_9STRA|nr:unnamed protein product [Phytophthora fragariaefolia]